MRYSLLFPALLLALNGFCAELILRGEKAAQNIQGTDLIRYVDEVTNPVYVQFANGSGPLLTEIPEWLMANYDLPDGFTFEFVKGEDDAFGWTHFSYQQSYQGIPVELAIIKAHAIGNRVKSVSGYSVHTAPVETVTLNAASALPAALKFVNASLYKWEVPAEENFLKAESENPEATFYPTGQLCYLPAEAHFSSNTVVPCWKFDIYAQQPVLRSDIYVNASTGEVVFENRRLKHVDSVGTATTSFSGPQTIVTDFFNGTSFRLRDAGRGNGVRTYDMKNGTSYSGASDFVHMDNVWPDSANIRYATDAHWGSEMTYDYFMGVHGRNSIDGNGFMLRSYVHYDVNYSNAFWDGQRMTYGDGNGSSLPYTTLDIAGHEITHGLTDRSADLIYSYESGALNESFSDIFGCAIESYFKPHATKNWLLGEDRGSSIRNMGNPKSKGDPNTYLGVNWFAGTADNGGVHTNSGVQNFWFYILTLGRTGTNDNNDAYNVTAIGLSKAEAIAFRNLTVYLSATSNYADARFFSIQSALDLYGSCSPELKSTVDAWYAVGIGQPYNPAVESDFVANVTSPCNLPATVIFTNNSNYNAKTYLWDFGDGQTSTAENPTHDYTTPGNYTVKLTATGEAACGSNVKTITNYISVSPPADAVAEDITVCDGDGAVIKAVPKNSSYWYINQSVTSPIHKGDEFRSAPLYADTVFYVQNVIEAAEQPVGPPNNSFGGGSSFNNDQYQIFDAFDKFTLVSVKVYATGDKFRTFELRDNTGALLQSKTDYIEDGEQVVNLGFIVSPGTDYQLGVTASSSPALYRNNNGANYPYTISNLVSITRSSANTDPLGYYYFFYDWKVKKDDCFGARIPVNVYVDYDPNCESVYTGIKESESTEFKVYPNPTNGAFNIAFELERAQQLNLQLIDVDGRQVTSLSQKRYEAGEQFITIENLSLSTGIYMLLIDGDDVHLRQRLVVE